MPVLFSDRRVAPLAYDRWSWTPAEYRLAAAVLGTEVTHHLYVIRHCAHHPALILEETVRVAVDQARTALHYASVALELEEVAVATIGQVTR